MALKKAEAVSVASISRSVERAVKLAAARHRLAVDRQTLLDRWEILGRRLRDVSDMNVAFKFAADVARQVKIPGMKVEPIVTRIGKDILVGFIDRGRLPRTLGR